MSPYRLKTDRQYLSDQDETIKLRKLKKIYFFVYVLY